MRFFPFFPKYCSYLAALCILSVSLPSLAEDDESITVSGKTYKWIESSRRYVGRGVQQMTGAVDSYLSRNKTEIDNLSFIRLRLGYVFEEGGRTYPNNDIKLKVDLPKTENKWSLIFETNPDEFENLEQQHQDNKDSQQAFKGDSNSIGAFKFIMNDWRYWKNDFDIGVKMPFPANPFVRYNMKRDYQLSELWKARFKHSVYYFREEGFGEQSSLTLVRPIAPQWTLFNTIDMQWKSQGEVLEFSNVVTFQHVLTARDTFLYRAGEFYQQHPSPHLQSYFVDQIYRRRLHSDWLFGEIIPGVTWAENDHFEGVFAITFRIEVIFN